MLFTVSSVFNTQWVASHVSSTQLTIGRYINDSMAFFSATNSVLTSSYVCDVAIVDHTEAPSVGPKLQVTLLVAARHKSGHPVLTHL